MDINSRVTMGFSEYTGDVKFLGFQLNSSGSHRYDIRARALYLNTTNGIGLPVLMLFDSTLAVPAPIAGQYILNFYTADKLIESDTVIVN